MTTKRKIVTAAAVLLAVAGAWMFWAQDSAPPLRPANAEPDGQRVGARAGLSEQLSIASAEARQRQAVAAPAPEGATTGTLVVHVRYGDDETPAAGIMLTVLQPGSNPRIEGWRGRQARAIVGVGCHRLQMASHALEERLGVGERRALAQLVNPRFAHRVAS